MTSLFSTIQVGLAACVLALLVADNSLLAGDDNGSSSIRFMLAESPPDEEPSANAVLMAKTANENTTMPTSFYRLLQAELTEELPHAGPALGAAGEPPMSSPEELPLGPAEQLPYQLVPISRLRADIDQGAAARTTDLHPDQRDFAAQAFADRQVIDARGIIGWRPLSYTPLGTAAAVCHRPTYFAQPRLERYGESRLLQPAWSGAHFYATVVVLPAAWMVRRPWQRVCRHPAHDPAGFDATAEFFQPPMICGD